VELAFLIDKSRWGEGLATEAASNIIDYARSQLGLSRLICLIVPGNVASKRVAEKVGMSFEREHEDELGRCHIYACSLGNRADAQPCGQHGRPAGSASRRPRCAGYLIPLGTADRSKWGNG
jgi:hypothetical protein